MQPVCPQELYLLYLDSFHGAQGASLGYGACMCRGKARVFTVQQPLAKQHLAAAHPSLAGKPAGPTLPPMPCGDDARAALFIFLLLHVFIFLNSSSISSPVLASPSFPGPSYHCTVLLLLLLFLLPVTSSRLRGTRCGILRPVGSLPRNL